ncbi:hypothetical protein [Dactylosporangium sp. CA-139066]|uniref:hypothetical protein n=1 Tax=Dactylosporangium sp. CA-139066 TaxID=3239930 RepID=UPI003D91B1E9
MKALRIGVTVLAAAGITAIATPAHAATLPSGQVLVWNAGGTPPGFGNTVKVKCPSTNPYVLEGSLQTTNGPVVGPISLRSYPGLSSVYFYNPNSLQSNLNVTVKLSVICSTWLPQSE